MTYIPFSAPSGPGVVRWGRSPLGFELRSRDALLLQSAARNLRPWLCGGKASWPITCHWDIEGGDSPGDSAADWIVRCAQDKSTLRVRTRDQALMVVEFAAVQKLIEHLPDAILAHGALLSRDGAGILIMGPCGAGKSTLACALWQRGWRLHGDDVTWIENDGCAAPVPRRVSLRHPSRDLLGEELWQRVQDTPSYSPTGEGCLFHPYEVAGGTADASQAMPLRTIIFLARRGVQIPPGQAQAMHPAQALLALFPYTSLCRSGPGTALQRLQPLANLVPSYDLGRGALLDMTCSIERLVEKG